MLTVLSLQKSTIKKRNENVAKLMNVVDLEQIAHYQNRLVRKPAFIDI